MFILLTLVILSAGLVVYALHNCSRTGLFPLAERNIDQYNSIDRLPKILPDYCETVIPPNIAPLNFLVEETGSQYCVKIHSKQGRAIQIFSRSPKIMIPQDRWHELLNANRGEQLNFDIFVKKALEIINYFKPSYWTIENPYSTNPFALHKRPYMSEYKFSIGGYVMLIILWICTQVRSISHCD